MEIRGYVCTFKKNREAICNKKNRLVFLTSSRKPNMSGLGHSVVAILLMHLTYIHSINKIKVYDLGRSFFKKNYLLLLFFFRVLSCNNITDMGEMVVC